MLTNRRKTVLYTGVTNDLQRRMREHKNGKGGVFTARYNCSILLYVEIFQYVNKAIKREKQIKNYSRKKKEHLIGTKNPKWDDLNYVTYL